MTEQTTVLNVVIDPSGARMGAKTATQAFDKMRKAAASSLDDINRMNKSTMTQIVQVFISTENRTKMFEKNVTRTFRRMQRLGNDLSRAWRASFGSIARIALPLGAIGGLKAAIESGIRYEKFQTTLSIVSGSSEAATKELDWLMETANRLGVSFTQSVEPFAKFSAAAKGLIPKSDIKAIFEAFSEASAALHFNRQEVQGVFLALQQMASKGRVSMEELRLQLAERIPGAMRLAARAMGVDIQTLEDQIRRGALSAEDFLVKFAAQISAKFGDAAAMAAERALGAFRRLQNAVFDATQAFVRGGLLQALGRAADVLANWLRKNQDAIKQIGVELGVMLEAGAKWVSQIDRAKVVEFFDSVKKAAGETVAVLGEIVSKISSIRSRFQTTSSFLDKFVSNFRAKWETGFKDIQFMDEAELNSTLKKLEIRIRQTLDKMPGVVPSDDKNLKAVQRDVQLVKDIQAELTKRASEYENFLLGADAAAKSLVDSIFDVGKATKEALQDTKDLVEMQKIQSDNEKFRASQITVSIGKAETRAFESSIGKLQAQLKTEQEKLNKSLTIALGRGPEETRDIEFRELAVDKYAQSLRKMLELQLEINDANFEMTMPLKALEDQIRLLQVEGLARERVQIAIDAENRAREAATEVTGRDLDKRLELNNMLKSTEERLLNLRTIYDYSAEIDPVVAATRQLTIEQEKMNLAMDAGAISTQAATMRLSELKDELLAAQAATGQMTGMEQFTQGLRAGLGDFVQEYSNVFEIVRSKTTDVIGGMSDAFVDFVATGKGSFRSLAQSVIMDITKMIAKMLLMKAIQAGLSMFGGGGAAGAGAAAGGAVAGSSMQSGSSRVGNTGIALLHKDEAVVPAKSAEKFRKEKFAPTQAQQAEPAQSDRPLNIINFVDKNQFKVWLQSNEGQDVVVNSVNGNREILGI